MRLSGTKLSSISQSSGLGNQLWDLSGTRPSLDLPFSDTKSLVDTTTGTTLVNHTRASSATYVGSDGLIKTATTNYLLYSEEADNPAWNILGSSILVDPDVTTAPDGAQTADKVKEATTTGGHTIEFTGFPFQSGTTYTVSFYAKAVERSRLRVTWPVIFTNRLSFVDISPGGYGVISDGGTVTSVLPAGNDWFRVVSTTTCTTTVAGARVGITLVDTGTNPVYTGDGTSGIYLWGAQLEQSSTVGEYVPTTSTINSAPRFDHDPTTGESLGLLVEESRTNLLPVSEDVTFPSYQRGEITPSINTAVAPDGSTTADTIAPTAVLTEHFIGYTTPSNVTAGTTYTFSAFVKPNGTDSVRIRFAFTGFNNENGSHNFTTGITSAGNCDFQIQPYANGWYRIQGTAVASSTGAAQPRIYPKGLNSWLGVPSEALFVWGAQLEEDSFPTSYIPTEGTTVTRAADVASISGANFSSWYRQDEGTVFAEANGSGPLIIPRATASAVDRIQLVIGISAVVVSGSVQAGFGNTTAAKRVLAYKANNTNMAFDGVTGVNDTSCAIPSVDYATIGYLDFGGATRNNGAIKRITFWPQRLPDETLQTITQ